MRTGLSRVLSDFMWYGTDHGRAEVVRRVRYVPFEYPFRSTFTYINPGYVAAGEILLARTGQIWDQFVAERILAPVGMERSSPNLASAAASGNVASPHIVTASNEVIPIAYFSLDNAGPCGSIHSTAGDMAKWLLMNLAGGLVGTNRVVSAESLAVTRDPATPMTEAGALETGGWAGPPFRGRSGVGSYYCMGWASGDWDGHPFFAHAGGVNGMNGSYAGLMPDLNLGVVILENAEWEHGIKIDLHNALFYWILDRYLDNPVVDYNPYFLAPAQRQMAAYVAAAEEWEAQRVPGTTTTLPPAAYANGYTNSIFGDAQFYFESGRMVCRLASRLVFDLEHWHYDLFKGDCRLSDYQTRVGPYYFQFGVTQGIITNMNNFYYNFTPETGAAGGMPVPGDFGGGPEADLAVYDQTTGKWRIRSIQDGRLLDGMAWGGPGLAPAPGDYDGDGKSDLAVYSEALGRWFAASTDGAPIMWSVWWGRQGLAPVSGDFDGDGTSDLAVYDTANGLWYIAALGPRAGRRVSGLPPSASDSLGAGRPLAILAWGVHWGWAGAEPVSGDFDGDGCSDLAVYDQANGLWYIASLATGQDVALAWAAPWGWAGASPVSGDFDGDGCTDLAVYASDAGLWYARSSAGSLILWAEQFGASGMTPAPADYDGDGRCDLALYDSVTGNWYARTAAGSPIIWAQNWGAR